MTASVGAVLGGRYEVTREVGRGGMGVVFEVRDKRTERVLAAKVLSPAAFADDEWRSRFDLESTATSDVRSEHVLPVLDAGIDEQSGLAYLITDLLAGADLGAALRARGRYEWREACAILEQVARGLDAIHLAGVVHRDLKPENLFLAESDAGETVKILDFGVAKVVALSRASLRSTRTLGSPLYMSPEQLEGEATLDGRSDVYAFGHLAYTLLVGEAYWERTWRAARGVYPVLIRVMKGARVPPSRRASERGVVLPAGFDRWFGRATARKADDRFDTAGEAYASLRSGLPRAGRLEKRLAVACSVGLVGAAGAWLSFPRQEPSSSPSLSGVDMLEPSSVPSAAPIPDAPPPVTADPLGPPSDASSAVAAGARSNKRRVAPISSATLADPSDMR